MPAAGRVMGPCGRDAKCQNWKYGVKKKKLKPEKWHDPRPRHVSLPPSPTLQAMSVETNGNGELRQRKSGNDKPENTTTEEGRKLDALLDQHGS